MLKDKTMTYISLFSSAGVGCYGFHMEGFECVATNELLPRRMDVQRVNKNASWTQATSQAILRSQQLSRRYMMKSANGKNLVTMASM